MQSIAQLTQAVQGYTANPQEALHQQITLAACHLFSGERTSIPVAHSDVWNFASDVSKQEPIWGLFAWLYLWGKGTPETDCFHQVWECARFAGSESRYSRLSASQYLHLADSLLAMNGLAPMPVTSSVAHLIRGNALRQLEQHEAAATAYQVGHIAESAFPFNTLRLADLWLATGKFRAAEALLHSLQPAYPGALEMLFLHAPAAPPNVAASSVVAALDPQKSSTQCLVWLIACDPVYLEKYGEQLLTSLMAAKVPTDAIGIFKIHVHVVSDIASPAPMETLRRMHDVAPFEVTRRTYALKGFTSAQRAALFACERFLVLPELLQRYQCPMLVTDVDVSCTRHPMGLLHYLDGTDVVMTRFRVVREAWDLHSATFAMFNVSNAAQQFVARLRVIINHLLSNHPNPWFADQVALYRVLELERPPLSLGLLNGVISDEPDTNAFFTTLHGSWHNS